MHLSTYVTNLLVSAGYIEEDNFTFASTKCEKPTVIVQSKTKPHTFIIDTEKFLFSFKVNYNSFTILEYASMKSLESQVHKHCKSIMDNS